MRAMEKMTRCRSVALTATAVFAFAAVAPAFAADQDFTLHNHTRHKITSLFVSPTGEDQWSGDILGQDILDDHTDLNVKFPREKGDCKWDVRAEFADGSAAQVRSVDFCAVSDVVIGDGTTR